MNNSGSMQGPASSDDAQGAGEARPETEIAQAASDDGRNPVETGTSGLTTVALGNIDTGMQFAPKLAGPWARLLARWFDIYLLFFILIFAIGWISSEYAPSFYIKFVRQHEALLTIELLPIVGIILAVMMRVTGTTLGKAVLGIKVQNCNGGNSLVFFLYRECKVWVFGLCMGIPLGSLATMISQHRKLVKAGSASYDKDSAVVTGESSPLRYGLAAIFLMGAVVLGGFFSDVAKKDEAEIASLQSWVNPVTRKTVKISKAWNFEEWEAEAGKTYYFNAEQLFSEVVFGYEPLDEYDIDPVSYGEALSQALSDDVLVKSEWEPLEINGINAVRAVGVHKSAAETNVEITVAVIGRSAWRILVFVRGRSFEKVPQGRSVVRELLSTAKDVNVPTNMPCEEESCVSSLSFDRPRLIY